MFMQHETSARADERGRASSRRSIARPRSAFGSNLLDAIAALYNAPDAAALDARAERIGALLGRLERFLRERDGAIGARLREIRPAPPSELRGRTARREARLV